MTAAHLNTLDLPELIDHAVRSAIVALTKLIDDPETQPETKRKAITDLLRFAARGIFSTPTPTPAATPTQAPSKHTPAPAPRPTPPSPTHTPRVPPTSDAPAPATILANSLAIEPNPPTRADNPPTTGRGKTKRPRTRYKKRAKR